MTHRHITRRGFLGLSIVAASAAIPTMASAEEAVSEVNIADIDTSDVTIVNYLTDEQAESILHEQIEQQVSELIASQESAGNDMRLMSRPSYVTEYGPKKNASTGWNNVANQPAGGTKIVGGGALYVNKTGGGNVSLSVSFSAPWGSYGFSVPFGINRASVGGVAINISGNGYYKAQQNSTYTCTPYIVYKVQDGKKTRYGGGCAKVLYRDQFRAKKVG